jgi:uncharacterized membrane protein YozB (DUF420 family)
MDQFFHAPGFLGTNANLAADFTLVAMLVIAALFTYGFYLARRGRYETHRWVQTTAVILNAILVLWMMILPYRDFVARDQGGPRPGYFYTITTIHALAGASALIFGVFVALSGNKLVPKALRFKNYKLFMRTAYILYMLATALGVVVYLTWFTTVPNPPLFQ